MCDEVAAPIFAGVIPKFVRACAAVVALVPPCAISNVPVTPGRGEALKTESALVLSKFTNKLGLDVIPVPPRAIDNVPDVIAEAL